MNIARFSLLVFGLYLVFVVGMGFGQSLQNRLAPCPHWGAKGKEYLALMNLMITLSLLLNIAVLVPIFKRPRPKGRRPLSPIPATP